MMQALLAKLPAGLTCAWCGRSFVRVHDHGPIPKFCKPSCRQRAYEQRRLERLIHEALHRGR